MTTLQGEAHFWERTYGKTRWGHSSVAARPAGEPNGKERWWGGRRGANAKVCFLMELGATFEILGYWPVSGVGEAKGSSRQEEIEGGEEILGLMGKKGMEIGGGLTLVRHHGAPILSDVYGDDRKKEKGGETMRPSRRNEEGRNHSRTGGKKEGFGYFLRGEIAFRSETERRTQGRGRASE